MHLKHPLVAMFLALGTLPLHAATIPAGEDTSSARGQLTKNAAKATTLPVNAKRSAYLHFDLSALPVSNAAQIRSASLRLYFPKVTTVGGGLSVHVVTTPWDEAVASAAPSHEATATAVIDGLSIGKKRFVTANVTAAVKAWVEGAVDNEGFAILSAADANLVLGAKEGTGTGYVAQLDVELNPAAGAIMSEQLASNLTLSGTTTGAFSGDGSGLTNLKPQNLSGTIAGGQLAANLTLAGTTAGAFTGSFSGNGSGLTNIPTGSLVGQITGAQITAGNVGTAQLAPNLTLGGTTTGTFEGDGSVLTNLTAANIAGQLANSQIATGLDAAKVGGGTVSNAEFALLDGATGNVQNQLNGKVSKQGDTVTGPLVVDGSVSVTGALRVPGAGVGTSGAAFIHTTVAGNVTSTIDHPLCNGDPNALLFITHQTLGDLNIASNLHNHPVGVAYFQGKWLIFNEDFAFMPGGLRFNVLVIKP